MQRKSLSIPEIAIIGATRAMLGAGVALLLSDYLGKDQRRAAGWTLLGVGVLTTIPIASQLFASRETPIERAFDEFRRDAGFRKERAWPFKRHRVPEPG
jgi:hypothetical protein